MSVKLKSITTTSWLVISDNEDRVGLLTSMNDKYTLMVKDIKKKFSSKEAVNEFFNEDVFSKVIAPTVVAETKKNCFIKGYPVDNVAPNEVFVAGCELPLYSKSEKSNIYFGAGYYCLDFPKMWMPAFSPKYSTLQQYNYLGPFTSEEEMKLMLIKARKERNERNKEILRKSTEL